MVYKQFKSVVYYSACVMFSFMTALSFMSNIYACAYLLTPNLAY